MSNFDILEVDWDNDPIILAAKLEHLADSLDRDLGEPAVAARQVIIDDVREHFEHEQAPSGERWAPWAPTYAARAQSENIGILRKTEDLYNEVTSAASWPVIGNDVWVNTASWPDYWRVHQQGGLIMSSQTMIRRMTKTRSGQKGARDHGRIPARPYVGVSAEAEAKVVTVYDQWLTGELDIISSSATGLAYFRGAKGQIGGRIGFR
jgi:phage gpG-like protein